MDEDFCIWIEKIIAEAYREDECNKKGFSFNEGSPIENGFKFCPYCGRNLKENRSMENQDV